MWKSSTTTGGPQLTNRNGSTTFANNNDNDDDWETDPDFINDVSEEEQRWGGARSGGSIE